ncbi:hypothetical protein [Terrabacter sp. 2RAF25]|uniref:hypothetical protein n=1 Tax=Terrabacter sp. 2RAF25 TaxID=3232998 RepID=UPI003F985B90
MTSPTSVDDRARLVPDTVAVASGLLGTTLRAVGPPFPGSRRTLVVRATGEAGEAYVVKRYTGEEGAETYAREAAALAALEGGARTPRLVAESADPRLVVMDDLGEGTHLADALLADDAERAAGGLAGWADAVAGLHVAGRSVRDAFVAGVRARSKEPLLLDYLPGQLADAVTEWERLAAALGLDVPAGTFAVLDSVPGRFRVDAVSLSAADMCPDNNFVTDAGLALLDFEWALWRPIAWDAAYLRVPWPTCWCAWSLDAAAAQAALERWRESVARTWPEVAGDDFDHDLDLATEAWAWLAGSWCLGPLVDGEPAPSNPVKPMPRMPDRTLRFLRTAAAGRAVPELAEVAGRLADAVTTRYAAQPVPLAPAFARGVFG